MNTGRLLELWAPPPGYRLASIVATTYELQADFLEEDLLPVALGLRLPAARGRDFRLELEQALQDVEVTIYLHPDGYNAGRRRSPRIDLIPLPETQLPKLHAKVSLLRFASEGGGEASGQIVRLIVGSANLTSYGYRENIEVAFALDDAPDGDSLSATAVRDAAQWLQTTIAIDTEQARRQHRDMQAVFDARTVEASHHGMRFVGLPMKGGLISALQKSGVGDVQTLTLVSPFWPTGEEPADVVASLFQACGGVPGQVRLLGPAWRNDEGTIYPVMPVALLIALMNRNVPVSVAAADPGFCTQPPDKDEDDEYGEFNKAPPSSLAARNLHAKMLMLEGKKSTVLAIGSFNVTRKGLGLHGRGNTEAGMLFTMPTSAAKKLHSLFSFATPWQQVGESPQSMVVAPPPMDGEGGTTWPTFIYGVRATRDSVIVDGDGAHWPDKVKLRMRDLRSRLVLGERDFDHWEISRPVQPSRFETSLALAATWLAEEGNAAAVKYPALPDLEIEISWDQRAVVLPVVFVDKSDFPVVERGRKEDERALIDWFLGLRPPGDLEGDGFGHSIDPTDSTMPREASDTSDILSYLVRDFVHALPGVRARVNEGGTTETGLRAALLGPRSPTALAEEVLASWRGTQSGLPRKTPVATAFQLVELLTLVRNAALPVFSEGASETLRREAMSRIRVSLDHVLATLPNSARTPALKSYLETIHELPRAAS